jgi:uncharacterized protein (TIGR02246 family)
MSKYDDAINRHDAAAVAALYTQDGVSGTSGMPHFGTFHGRQAIEKGYAQFFQSWPINSHITSVDRVSAVAMRYVRSENGAQLITSTVLLPTTEATIHQL